ncbi:MAG TPA: hypothetical protein VJ907_07590 [Halanaerobiales bacterium]|nr:hypothetical protein [Halanaerobiales bacterium]
MLKKVNQRLDNIQISDSLDDDDIILEFANQLDISLEDLERVYDDSDDN